jgi:hypothetical protein
LDSKRLGAQWREALLCRNVLKGMTVGYKNHPQFLRIAKHPNPIGFINAYLSTIWKEASHRGYSYDLSKIEKVRLEEVEPIKVTCGQVSYEFKHNQHKLKDSKNSEKFLLNENLVPDGCNIQVNPLFIKIPGEIEDFEKPKNYDE